MKMKAELEREDMREIGTRIVQIARMARVLHLAEMLLTQQGSSRGDWHVGVGGAGCDYLTDETPFASELLDDASGIDQSDGSAEGGAE